MATILEMLSLKISYSRTIVKPFGELTVYISRYIDVASKHEVQTHTCWGFIYNLFAHEFAF